MLSKVAATGSRVPGSAGLRPATASKVEVRDINHSFRDEYYARRDEAREKYKVLSSDRAHMFLLQGPPNEMVTPSCGRMLQPIEIWKYFYIPGMGHDVRFLFYVPRRHNEYKLWVPLMSGDNTVQISRRTAAVSEASSYISNAS